MLSSHEGNPDQRARRNGHRGGQAQPVFGRSLQPVDHQQDAGERKDSAEKIDGLCVGIAVFGQELRSDRKKQHHHRHCQQKHRAPPEILEHHAAEERTDYATDRVAGNPHADGERPLMLIEEHIADQRQGGRCDRRTCDAKQRARRDQHSSASRIRRDNRGDSEGDGSEKQQSTPAYPVAQRAHRDQRTGDEEPVDVENPQQLRAGGFQVRAQMGHSQVQHCEVHRV